MNCYKLSKIIILSVLVFSIPAGNVHALTDALFLCQSMQYLNGITTNYGHDALSRLTEISSMLSAIRYTLDPIGNITSKTEGADAYTYGYDRIYQLLSATGAGSESFTYDRLGNRTTSSNGTTTIPYTHNELNQYTAVNSVAQSFDSNGNLTSDGTNTYTYDYDNRLISSDHAPAASVYSYDVFGRRIKKEVTVNSQPSTVNYLYDGDNLLIEYNADWQPIKYYVYSDNIDEPIRMTNSGGDYYYHADGLGSITAITDTSGNVVEKYQYDSFGNVTILSPSDQIRATSDIGNAYMFTGREYDAETGLYFYRARTYSPQTGRFLQTDPIGYWDSMNLYQYCGNNPVNWIDPWGLWKGKGHIQLTEPAMGNRGFSKGDIRRVVESNENVDRITNQTNDPAHYMPGTVDEAEGIIENSLKRAVQNELEGNHDEALEALGEGLHTLQDKWAHEEQGAGWADHLLGDPDNPSEHMNEFLNAYRDTKNYIDRFLQESEKRRKGCK